jgi:hypothetical protein
MITRSTSGLAEAHGEKADLATTDRRLTFRMVLAPDVPNYPIEITDPFA